MDPLSIVIFVVCVLLFIFLLWMVPVGLWFTALVSGVHVSLIQLILMRWRKVPPGTIVNAMITGAKAGIPLNRNELEAHFLAGGHVVPVVNALVSAGKANIPLDFKAAAAIDLAGRNVLEAIQTSVNPKVINTPPVAGATIFIASFGSLRTPSPRS